MPTPRRRVRNSGPRPRNAPVSIEPDWLIHLWKIASASDVDEAWRLWDAGHYAIRELRVQVRREPWRGDLQTPLRRLTEAIAKNDALATARGERFKSKLFGVIAELIAA
jgi:hypothetical protein